MFLIVGPAPSPVIRPTGAPACRCAGGGARRTNDSRGRLSHYQEQCTDAPAKRGVHLAGTALGARASRPPDRAKDFCALHAHSAERPLVPGGRARRPRSVPPNLAALSRCALAERTLGAPPLCCESPPFVISPRCRPRRGGAVRPGSVRGCQLPLSRGRRPRPRSVSRGE